MFDAGAIIARMRLEQDQFDKDLREAERKLDRLSEHKIKLTAVFDDASTNKARRDFATLDQMLSRDAMQRLRSGAQGSVFGALISLFSPHQVSGGPTAQQAATQGLLGRIVGSPGSGGTVGTTRTSSQSGAGQVIQRVIGQAAGGSASGKATTVTEKVRQVQEGPGVSVPGEVTEKIKLETDEASRQKTVKDSGDTGDRAGREFSRRFSVHLTGLLAVFKGVDRAAGGSGGVGGNALGNLAGGMGPGILGLSARHLGIASLIGTGVAALPALAGGVGALGVAGIGAGIISMGAKQLIGTKNTKQNPNAQGPLFDQAKALGNQFQGIMRKSAMAMAAPLEQAFSVIPKMLKQLEPVITQVFGSAGHLIMPFVQGIGDLAKTVLPLLSQALRAVAPLVRPLLDGFAKLAGGLLSGLVTLLKAAAPAVKALAGGLGDLGSGLGKMLGDFAPVIKASSTIFSALFDVLSGIFPIVGKLAQVFASSLAPVFVQLAGIIRGLLPFLTIVGKLFASLAGAVMRDLIAAIGAVAQILQNIEPGINAFAKAITGVFDVLENTGIFAILGDALESLVKPISALINALLKGLTPLLPPIIMFIGQLSTMLANGLARAVSAIIPPLTTLATAVLGAMATILPVVLPILTEMMNLFTGAVAQAVGAVATALADILNAIPPSVLKDIVIAVLAIVGAVKAWAVAQAILNIALDANPIGLITLAIGALVVAAAELITHWKAVWTEVKRIAGDVWHFIDNAFHNGIVQDILAIWSLGLVPLLEHWRTVWGDIQGVATTFWHWLSGVFGSDIANFFTRTVPGYFSSAVGAVSRIWNGIKAAVDVPIGIVEGVVKTLGHIFDNITSALGLGKPFGYAQGGRITAGSGPTADDVLVRVSRGETIVDAGRSRLLAPLFKAVGIPGYAAGGQPLPPNALHTGVTSNPTGGPSLLGGLFDLGKILAAIATGNAVALTNAIEALLGKHQTSAPGLIEKIVTAIPKTLIHDAVGWLIGHGQSAAGGGSSGGGPGGGAPAANAALAKHLFPAWATGSNWTSWNYVAMAESGWNQFAHNPSGAFGIAQALGHGVPGGAGKYGNEYGGFGLSLAGDRAANNAQPNAQITWMHNYIRSVWKTPQAAAANESANHWYDNGGWMMPGGGGRNGTRMPEAVLTPGQSQAFLALAQAANAGGSGDLGDKLDRIGMLLGQLIDVTGSIPVGLAGGIGGAFDAASRHASFVRRYPRGGA